jgi:putative SOS response-associated peptidase YedK
MCGRFVQYTAPEDLAEQFALESWCSAEPRYNVAPTQPVLVVRVSDNDVRELVKLRWGLVPAWSDGPDNRYSMINARAETVSSKPAYRAAFARRRCLIPADGFYEWQAGEHGKTPFLIRRQDRQPFAMAGLWEHWQGQTGEVIESCTIIVTDANALLEPIHDRMPVILDADHYAQWLDPGNQDKQPLEALLKPNDPSAWTAYPVSREVNKPSNDGPQLIEPER